MGMNYLAAELTRYQQPTAKSEAQQAAGNLPAEIKKVIRYNE